MVEYYSKTLGEKNFQALNDVLKGLIKDKEENTTEITKLRSELRVIKTELEQLKQLVNVFKALSMGHGSTT